jgi:serine phosphatase RsbU (regulator of sigma subunit)
MLQNICLSFLFVMTCLLPSVADAQSPTAGGLSENLQQKIQEYDELLNQAKANESLNEQSRWINKKAFLYWENHLYKQAIEQFEASLDINQKLGNQNGVASINQQIGMIYADQEQYHTSLQYFDKALQMRRQQGDKSTLANALINVAVAYNNVEDYKQAITHLEEALGIVQELKEVGLIRSCCAMLAENYEKLGDADKSFEYFNLYASLEKKLQQEQIRRKEQETEKKIVEMQEVTEKVMADNKVKEKKLFLAEQALRLTEALNREKEARIDVLKKEKQLKDLALKEKEARLKNELLLKNSFIGGFTLVGLLAVMLFMGYSMKQKANQKLSTQNTEIISQKEEISKKSLALENALTDLKGKSRKITQSITYAKRIQQAMLPEEEQLQRYLPESFILFKPKDIVSGDFYWFAETSMPFQETHFESSASRKFIIAAIDCTGHGVPGAFMSMIGYNLLDEIVARGVHTAGDILKELHHKVNRALKQDETENNDGMDMSLCVVDPERKVLEFAGAKNPLVYIENGNLHLIKGDKKGIGGKSSGEYRDFTTHEVPLEGVASFYIFSDGYQDQFGGEKKRKFMSKQLRKLLHRIHDLPMEKQKKVLNHTIENWRRVANELQVDDILVMGFRLDERTLESMR